MAKWDPVAAEKLYVEDRTQSFQTIADKFGVTKRTVERAAKKNEWVNRRHTVGEKGLAEHEETLVKDLAELDKEHEAIFRNIYVIANQNLQSMVQEGPDGTMVPKPGVVMGELQKAAAAAKIGIEGVRVIRGLPIVIAKSENKNVDEITITEEEARGAADAYTKNQQRRKSQRENGSPASAS